MIKDTNPRTFNFIVGHTELAQDVNSLISSGISDKRHKGYDPTAFPQVTSERFLELKSAFSRFDKDMVGYISTNRLEDVMTILNKDPLEEREILHMKETADPNGKGIITFSKFVILTEINRFVNFVRLCNTLGT